MSNYEDITGKSFNGLFVVGFSHKVKGKVYWNLVCSCGKNRSPLRADSIKKHSGKCTCPIVEGTVKGDLTFLSMTKVIGKHSYCEVSCSCGRVYETRLDTFKSNSSGCGRCKNVYYEEEDYLSIDISTAKHSETYTKIDKEDYDKVKHLKWYAVSGTRTLYAQASDGKVRLSLHRLLLDCEKGSCIDHKDGNGLNNTKTNLREVDRQANGMNTPIPSNNTSGVMGVSATESGSYRAYITVDGVQQNLGTFVHMSDAVSARRDAEVKLGFYKNHGRTDNPV